MWETHVSRFSFFGFQLEDEEEAELEDKFDVLVSVKDPEKVGEWLCFL